ncbi:MAG: hypothetical protein ACHP79_02830 [Terriglobales bacterium]
MRKLWPPYYDDFSHRVWACILSVSINLTIGLLMYLRISLLLWTRVPAVLSYMAIAGRNSEEPDVNWPGLIVALTVNLLFYYFIAWLAINIFRQTKAWWPEKRS